MDITRKSVLFFDLDDTLIKTSSGKTFPEDVTDFRIRKDVVDKIKELYPQYIIIVSNQAGIPEYISKEDFESKLHCIERFIEDYTGVFTISRYCDSKDKNDPRRKPNTGMLEEFQGEHNKIFRNKDCVLMIGDASGKPNDFSDSDKKTAENFGIDYLDVEDFINLKIE